MRAAQRRWVPRMAAVSAIALLVGWAPAGDDAGGPDTSVAATGDVQTDPAELGEVTLTVWDQEVRGGQNEQIEAAERGLRWTAYPNITIERAVAAPLEDLRHDAAAGACRGDDAPDVVQANNSRSDSMGAVRGRGTPAGAARRVGGGIRLVQSASRKVGPACPGVSTARTAAAFGEWCQSYGLPQVGEIVGRVLQQDEAGRARRRAARRTCGRLRRRRSPRRRRPARRRCCSATSDEVAGRSTCSGPIQGQFDRRRVTTSRSSASADAGCVLGDAGGRPRRGGGAGVVGRRPADLRRGCTAAPTTTRRGRSFGDGRRRVPHGRLLARRPTSPPRAWATRSASVRHPRRRPAEGGATS